MLLLPLLALFGACSDGATPTPPAPTPSPPAADRPDMVLVVVDTMRADHVGIYGDPRPDTPAIDALARDGAWFYRAYAHSGWTLASFASLFTGLYPFEHRVGRAPDDPTRFGRLAPKFTTLAEALTAAGYNCGAVINNTFLAPEFGLKQGFDAGWDWRGADDRDLRHADATVDAALAWIAKQPSPFFLLVHFMEPHADYDPPPSTRGTFTGKGEPPVPVPFPAPGDLPKLMSGGKTYTDAQWDYVRALYDEEILAVDRQIGRLLDALMARSRWDRTLIAVTADHGEEFHDHGSFEHGHSLYGELTRVPLVLYGPGVAHGRIDTLVTHADLFQGLIAAGRAQRPPGTHGRDILEIARDHPRLAGRVGLSENTLYGPPLVSIVDDHYRLVVDEAASRAEIWQVAADGTERVRLQGDEQTREGRRLFEILMKIRGNTKPVPVADGPTVGSSETFEQLKALGYLE